MIFNREHYKITAALSFNGSRLAAFDRRACERATDSYPSLSYGCVGYKPRMSINSPLRSFLTAQQSSESGGKRDLSMETPLYTRIGYDPQKIVAELARIKSLRQTERRLKNNCKALESRASQYNEIIPLCEQIMRLGIGFPELAAFHAAVMKKQREYIGRGN